MTNSLQKNHISDLAFVKSVATVGVMTLGEKLKSIRHECGLSQESIGSQGFVSTPGWIKLENGQRSPSEKLIDKLVGWLVADKHVRSSAAKGLKEDLLTLKYLESHSTFVRELARAHAKQLAHGETLLAKSPVTKPKRGRPKSVPGR